MLAGGLLAALPAIARGQESSAPASIPPPAVEPLVSAGAGVYSAFQSDVSFFLTFSVEADASPNSPPAVNARCPRTRHGLGVECGSDEYRYGRLEGAAAFTARSGGPEVSYADLRFYPAEHWLYAPIPSETDNVVTLGLEAAPVAVGRNVSLDQALRLSVPAFGLVAGDFYPLGAGFVFAARGGVDLLGYKAVRYLSPVSPFDGVHIAGATLLAGLAWSDGEDVAMSLDAGGEVDINSNWARYQSDVAAKLALRIDVGDRLELRVTPRAVQASDPVHAAIGRWDLSGEVAYVF